MVKKIIIDKPKFNKYFKKDIGVVGIVAAILLVGLIVTIFGIIQTIYVPNWMKEIEVEHMNDVNIQFTQFKYVTDVQLLLNQTSDIYVSSPISLGSDKIPFLLSENSYGSLEIIDNQTTIEISNSTLTNTHSCNGIKYQSRNTYYIDQAFIYEIGGIVTSQNQGILMSSSPHFSADNNNTFNISFTAINIMGLGGKSSSNGYSTTSIRSKYLKNQDQFLIIDNATQIKIFSNYYLAWEDFFNDTFSNADLSYGLSNDYFISKSEAESSITLYITKNNVLYFNIKKISTQIAPGWIS